MPKTGRTLRALAVCTSACLFASSCRIRSPGTETLHEDESAGDTVGGRSVFDHLIAQAPGGKVPYPFTALLKHLGTFAVETRVTAIPFSRSLQKKAADPDFFRRPRLVATFAGANWSDLTNFVPIANNVFLGHVPGTEQIEVISYNAYVNRFEFELVENYGNEAAAVKSADRNLCLSCHQDAIPIFPNAAWVETIVVSPVKTMVQVALDDPSPRTLDLPDTIGDPGMIRRSSASAELDGSVRRASILIDAGTAWTKVCDASTPIGLDCRINGYAAALYALLGLTKGIEAEPIIVKITPPYPTTSVARKDSFITTFSTTPPPFDPPDQLLTAESLTAIKTVPRITRADLPVTGVWVRAARQMAELVREQGRTGIIALTTLSENLGAAAAEASPAFAQSDTQAMEALRVRWEALPDDESRARDAFDFVEAASALAMLGDLPPRHDPTAARPANTILRFPSPLQSLPLNEFTIALVGKAVALPKTANENTFAMVDLRFRSNTNQEVNLATIAPNTEVFAVAGYQEVDAGRAILPKFSPGNIILPPPVESLKGRCTATDGVTTCKFDAPRFVWKPGSQGGGTWEPTGAKTPLGPFSIVPTTGSAATGSLTVANGLAKGDHKLACAQLTSPAPLRCLPYDTAKLESALLALRADANSVADHPLRDPIFRELALTSALLTKLGATSLPTNCCEGPDSPPPEGGDDPVERLKALLTSKELKTIANSCGACHAGQNEDIPAFVTATTQRELCLNVAARQAKIKKYVETKRMPPPASPNAQTLSDDTRSELVAFLGQADLCSTFSEALPQ